MKLKCTLAVTAALGLDVAVARSHAGNNRDDVQLSERSHRDAFIDDLVDKMTLEDLALQLHLMFGGDIAGEASLEGLYDETMRFSPHSPVGVMHDWYPMNKTDYNAVQKLQLDRSHLKVPFMLVEECLHGVGSFKQSIFPQNIGMAASWDTDIVYNVGRAIATEARSIGIHGCFSPVLDLARDPRWGRVQEAFGEDKILTSHMGVAYAAGMSKNKSWADTDAVFPIMKHFAAHGSPRAGLNAAPYTGSGPREIMEDMLVPFKAVYELGGARGVMMAYNEIDGVPAAVHPMLYDALEEWGFDGFTLADDTCIHNLLTQHLVSDNEADALQQWYNAGGMIDFYDFGLESTLKTTKALVANHTVPLATLQSHVKKIMGVKYDLGLFEKDNAFIANDVDPLAIADSHQELALEAAHKSIVLLKNDNETLPLKKKDTKIALVGPFADTNNFGDYSGLLGQVPIKHAQTIRQGMLNHLKDSSGSKLSSSWGANSWEYNNQYAIPPYLLSANGTKGGLRATYYAKTDFTKPMATRMEVPPSDWGLYPPEGLPSTNFSAVWEGELSSPVDVSVDGWIGVGIGANTTAKLFIDGKRIVDSKYGLDTTILGNIQSFDFTQQNSTLPPLGGKEFTFEEGKKYHVRIEYQAWNQYKKTANMNSVNSQALFWWNLVSPGDKALEQAVSVAKDADVIVMALGAAWNSDGESGDRATLDLAPSQDALAKAMYKLDKPVVIVLEGGRPFAIPDHYEKSSAVLSTFFGGQASGQAIADVLFGTFNPGGRVPITVPYSEAQIPTYYNYRPSSHLVSYLDITSNPSFPFGFGLSYTNFSLSSFSADVRGANGEMKVRRGEADNLSFAKGDTIDFSVTVENNGTQSGSYVVQIYLLGRVSMITQPTKQLMGFERVYLDKGEKKTVHVSVDVDRYMMILNRKMEWELEKGHYTFALLDNSGSEVDDKMSIELACK